MPVRVLSSVPHHAELMAWFGKSVCVQVRDGAGASRALDVPEFFSAPAFQRANFAEPPPLPFVGLNNISERRQFGLLRATREAAHQCVGAP
jgi:hypothetical protein